MKRTNPKAGKGKWVELLESMSPGDERTFEIPVARHRNHRKFSIEYAAAISGVRVSVVSDPRKGTLFVRREA